jgi:hypothetical protein
MLAKGHENRMWNGRLKGVRGNSRLSASVLARRRIAQVTTPLQLNSSYSCLSLDRKLRGECLMPFAK